MPYLEKRSIPCRAKAPSACPYHGAIMRMEAAAKVNDLDAYFEARKEVEANEIVDWEDPSNQGNPNLTLKDLNTAISNYKENEYGGGMYGFAEKLRDRSYSWNRNKPTTPLYLENVGEITFLDSNQGEAGDGQEMWIVFAAGTKFFRLIGTYSSWDSSEWHSVEEVKISSRIIRDYVKI